MTTTLRNAAYALGLASLLCFWGSTEGQARNQKSTSTKVDTFVVLIPRHAIEDIEKNIVQMTGLRATAKLRLDRAKDEVRALENLLDERQKDLDALEAHLDSLDSDRDAHPIVDLKKKISLLEKFKDLLELRKEVREAEVQSAEAAIAYTQAQEEFYEGEVILAKKTLQRDAIAKKQGSAAEVATMDVDIKRLEEELLELWEKALKRQDGSVSEEQDFLDMLKKLGEAQESFHTP